MGQQLRKADLKLWTVFFMVFILCSSGPYGLEDMVSAAGPGTALLLLLAVPLVWGIPVSLVCAELGSALPEEGGFYKWVQRGLGEFWGFQSGWWYTLSLLVDSAVYIVLSVGYVGSWLDLSPWGRWLLGLLFIALFAWVNVRGIGAVGWSSTVFSAVILIPLAAILTLGLFRWQFNPWVPFTPPGQSFLDSLGLGFAVAIWLYSGYEAIGTIAGEVRDARRLIPRALLLAMPFIIAVHFVPTLVGLASVGQWERWASTGGLSFVEVGAQLGGPLLGLVMLAAALAANLAVYNGCLAAGTRAPFVMAVDGLFPPLWGKLHPRYGTPYVSILVMAAVHTVLITGSFEALIVVDVFLFLFSYVLILATAVALRVKEPGLERPFRIPVGTAGLVVLLFPSLVCIGVALFGNGATYAAGGLAGVASGPLAYLVFRRRYGGLAGRQSHAVDGPHAA